MKSRPMTRKVEYDDQELIEKLLISWRCSDS